MGHMLKNTVFRSGSYALGVPTGTSMIGPDSPVNGQTRFNTGTNRLEFYANITGTPSWNAVGREGNVVITKVSDSGDGNTTQFPMGSGFSSGDENKVIVHVGTVYQIPTTNYTFGSGINAGNIIFSSAPSVSAVITIISGFASTVSTLA
jgi:hypothetical protein